MSPTLSHRAVVAAWLAQRSGSSAPPSSVPLEEPELIQLRRHLAAMRPQHTPPALAGVAELAFAAGASVRFGDFSGTALDRLLHLDSLPALEAGLRQLDAALQAPEAGASATLEPARDAARQATRDVSPAAMLDAARMAVRRARRRAHWIAANARVHPLRRREKQEMEQWLTVWLQTPQAFWSWLELRQRTREYHELCDALTPTQERHEA